MTPTFARGNLPGPMRYEPFDWYETPRFYDVVYDTDSESEADFIEAAYDLYATCARTKKARRVLEPACGTGRLLRVLSDRGWQTEGFDISKGMLSMARARCPNTRLTEASMQDFRAPDARYPLGFNLLSSFKYLAGEQDARAHLQRMADVLVPGGIYLLGLHITDYDWPGRRRERWVGRDGDMEVVVNLQLWPPHRRQRTEQVRSRLVVREHGTPRGYESRWQFRTYDEKQLASLLASEPRLTPIAWHGFDHRIDRPIDPSGDRLDRVLVLLRS